MIKSLFRGSRKASRIITLDDMVRSWLVQQEQWGLEDAKYSGLSCPAPQKPDAKISLEKIPSTVINKMKKVAKKLLHPKLSKKPEPTKSKLGDGRPATLAVAAETRGESRVKEATKKTERSKRDTHPAQFSIGGESIRQPLAESVEGESSETAIDHRTNSESFVPADINEEELLGDKEVVEVMNRRRSKNQGTEEVEEFPETPDISSPVPAQSPHEILQGRLAEHLSPLEREEICEYSAVYYVGQGSEKKQATRHAPRNNYGYDSDKGEYIIVDHDHLAYRYEILGTLGKGSFGQVIKCYDHAMGHTVAIKVPWNNKNVSASDYNEVSALEHIQRYGLKGKDTIVTMKTHFKFRHHLWMVFELLDMNVYELIAANEFKGFTLNFIRRFARRILSSLMLLQRHHIIHCDLKPENILLCHPTKSAVKLADFGSSTFNKNKGYTYMQTRYYRAPEVILGTGYNSAINMWSLGCIVAELCTGVPIFTGESEQEQLACIMEVIGLPDKSLVKRSRRQRNFFDSSGAPRHIINLEGRRCCPGTRTLMDVLKCDDKIFVDFVARCLVWDPDRRLDPIEAMDHPFMTVGRGNITTNMIAARPSKFISLPTFSFWRRDRANNKPKTKTETKFE